jgi:enamine deaminase RidA (YjgF/YER057c/UK114 family)
VSRFPPNARWLFTAGHVGVRPDGRFRRASKPSMIRSGGTRILADAGMGTEDVVRLNVYSTDPDGLKHVMAHREKYLTPGHKA